MLTKQRDYPSHKTLGTDGQDIATTLCPRGPHILQLFTNRTLQVSSNCVPTNSEL